MNPNLAIESPETPQTALPSVIPARKAVSMQPADGDSTIEKQRRLEQLRKQKRLSQLRQQKVVAAQQQEQPSDLPEYGSPEWQRRRQELKSELEVREAAAEKAGKRLDGLKRIVDVAAPGVGIGQGVTLGFGDEIIGAATSLATGTPYEMARDNVRDALDVAKENNPVGYIAGELAGGLATGGGGATRSGVAPGYRAAASQGAKSGAIYGEAYGAGTSEGGASSRLRDSLSGAGYGAIGGAMLQPVTRFIGNRIARIRNSGAQGRADAIIIRKVMEKNRVDRDGALNLIRETNPDDPDLAFQKLGLEDLAQGFGGVNAASAKILSDAVEKQQRGQQARISDGVKRIIGAKDFTSMSNDVADRLKTEGRTLYERVLPQPIQTTASLKALLSRPSMQAAIKKAKKVTADLGVENDETDLAFYQVAKESLDYMISARYRQGKNKEARAIQKVQTDFLSELDRQVPEYAQARRVWAGQSANKAALEFGRKSLSLRPEDVAKATEGYSRSERQHLLAGILQGVDDRLKKSGHSDNATSRFKAEGLRDVFRVVLSDEQAERIVRLLERESKMTATGRNVRMATGSQTAPRQKNIADAKSLASNPMRRGFATSMDVAADGRNSVSRALRFIGNLARRENPAVVEAMALRLAGTPQDLAQAMVALSPSQRSRAERMIRVMETRSGIIAGVTAPRESAL